MSQSRPRLPRSPFERALRTRLRRLLARTPGAILVVGASGGPDSTALLVAAAALREELGIVRIVAAHFHHGLREAADGDVAFVQVLAHSLGCRFMTARASDLERAARGQGLESAAREARYAFLTNVAARIGAAGPAPVVVAVAHTAQDQAETVLLRALRGAGLRGLGAMAASRRLAPGSDVRLVRPLLELSRADVVEYLASKKIVAREDEHNDDARFARVRVRSELLPLARQRLNPRADEALARLALAAREASRVLEAEARRLLARAARPGCGPVASLEVESVNVESIDHPSRNVERSSVGVQNAATPAAAASLGVEVFDAATLAVASDAILEVALARVLRRRLARKLARVHVSALVSLVRRAARLPGLDRSAVALPSGLAAWIAGDKLVLGPKTLGAAPLGVAPETKPRGEPSGDVLEIPVPGEVLDEVSGLVFEARLEPATRGQSGADGAFARADSRSTQFIAELDRARAAGRLTIRRRRAGDRFLPLGASGTQTLKRFFIDRKIPRAERSRVPIVTLEDLPIWVVGERIDDRVKVTAATREVLVLSAKPASGDSRS